MFAGMAIYKQLQLYEMQMDKPTNAGLICAVIKLEWAMIKAKLGSVKN